MCLCSKGSQTLDDIALSIETFTIVSLLVLSTRKENDLTENKEEEEVVDHLNSFHFYFKVQINEIIWQGGIIRR